MSYIQCGRSSGGSDLTGKVKTFNVKCNSTNGAGSGSATVTITINYDENGNVSSVTGSKYFEQGGQRTTFRATGAFTVY